MCITIWSDTLFFVDIDSKSVGEKEFHSQLSTAIEVYKYLPKKP